MCDAKLLPSGTKSDCFIDFSGSICDPSRSVMKASARFTKYILSIANCHEKDLNLGFLPIKVNVILRKN